jgi:hypothetical protein
VIESIDELDLEPFYAAYRAADGHGGAAREPKMMLTLLAYAYSVGERSPRAIERRCPEDVASRVICANQIPDHATIARARVRHERALAELFGQVLGLCADAGIVDEVVFGQPVAQVGRQQHRLLSVAGEEVLGHAWMVQSGPDGRGFCDSLRDERQWAPRAHAGGAPWQGSAIQDPHIRSAHIAGEPLNGPGAAGRVSRQPTVDRVGQHPNEGEAR